MNEEELIKETMMLDYSQLVMHNVYMIKENKRLENIIKEVREYIDKELDIEKICRQEKSLTICKKGLLEILDKDKV